VGARVDLKGVFHGYLYANGTFTDIDYPGASQIPGGAITSGINDLGAIAGTFSDAQGFQHGFLRTVPFGCANSQDSRCKPVYQQLDVPGAAQTTGIVFETGPGLGTAANGINLEGNVVGMHATHGLYSAGFESRVFSSSPLCSASRSNSLGRESRAKRPAHQPEYASLPPNVNTCLGAHWAVGKRSSGVTPGRCCLLASGSAIKIWREGPPLTVLWQSANLLAGPSSSG
jgi:hypothetical protein